MRKLSASFSIRPRAPGQAFLAYSSLRLTVPRPLRIFMLCLSPQDPEAHLVMKTGRNLKGMIIGTSLVAQWLRLHVSPAEGTVPYLVREIRTHVPGALMKKNYYYKLVEDLMSHLVLQQHPSGCS